MDGKKGGKIPAIPEETRAAMRDMRATGKTIKEIADFFHVSQNSVIKYSGGVPDTPDPSTNELDVDVEALIADQHAKRVLNQSKKIDADTVHAGEALREHFKSKGIDIDLRKIPMEQLIKLVKSPGMVENMDTNVKDVFNNWLVEKVNKGDSAPEKLNGKINFNDVKEILMLKFLMKMAGDGDDSPQNHNIISEMRAENEKQRQFYEKKIEDMGSKFRDLLIERKFQDVEDRQASFGESLQTQLADISGKIEAYRGVALSGNGSEKLDAITHLENLAAERDRVNVAMQKLNQSQIVTTAPDAADIYKKADGSLDYVRFAGDKLESTVKMITGAMSKPTPERKLIQETPAPASNISPDQAEHLYQQFLKKPSLTPAETEWVGYYLPIRAQLFPSALESRPAEPASPPSEAMPEPVDPVETAGILDRLQVNEENRVKSLQGML